MTRRSFVFSWGRKLFFGFSWPLSSLLGLVYLQSFVLPQGAFSWLYFILSFIGIYGLLNATAYFLIYCPVVFLLPTYYVCRFWSLLVILSLNLFILFDGLVFGQYREHINSFFSQYLLTFGAADLFHFSPFPFVLFVGISIFLIVFWLRGELTWKVMQKRFSNPVKNWYLLMITLAALISGLMLYRAEEYAGRLISVANVFPMGAPKYLRSEDARDAGSGIPQKLYYPSQELKCGGKQNPNIVFIVIKNWVSEVGQDPLLQHLSTHGRLFSQHHTVSDSSEGGLFSLLYGLSPLYLKSAQTFETNPELFEELKRRKYKLALTGDAKLVDTALFERNGFGPQIDFSGHFFDLHYVQAEAAQSQIYALIGEIQRAGLINQTLFVVTGAAGNSELKTPLLFLGRKTAVTISTVASTHYDVVPTIMRDLWDCKNNPRQYSQGTFIDEVANREWFPVERGGEMEIYSLKEKNFLRLSLKEFDPERSQKVLRAIRESNLFFKRR